MKIAILGAGISGLATAWFCERMHPRAEILLIDKSSRIGGWIQTVQEGGFLFEKGPRALPIGRAATLWEMIRDAGLEKECIFSETGAGRRYIYWKNTLHRVPQGPWSFICSPLTRDLTFSLLKEWRVKRVEGCEETLREFFSRRIDPRFAERLVDPLARGIYAGSIDELSLEACFPRLKEWETDKGSLTRGFLTAQRSRERGYFSLRKGLSALLEGLRGQLRGEILLGTEVYGLSKNYKEKMGAFRGSFRVALTKEEKEWTVNTSRGNFYVDKVISALPAFALAEILDTSMGALLKKIPYRSLYAVHVGFRKRISLPKGFGYLVPSGEKESLLGVVFDSQIFPQQDDADHYSRLTLMMDASFPNPEMAQRYALHILASHLKISQMPDYMAASFLDRAIPQYVLGHRKSVEELNRLAQGVGGLWITGNYLKGLALEDIALHAKNTAINVLGSGR